MKYDSISLPPELLAGIGPGAARSLRRALEDEKITGPFVLEIDPELPPNEAHVYVGDELKVRITNIGA